METIVPLARIRAQAQSAVLRHVSADQCCPWPAMSDAAHAFKALFLEERMKLAARIKFEAESAAHVHADVNAACPYPFSLPTGQLYRALFTAARAQQDRIKSTPTEEATA